MSIAIKFKRYSIFALLLIASAGVALVNRQPVFYWDTTAYIREPDYAIVRLLGTKFKTSWTQENSSQSVGDSIGAQQPKINSPADQLVMAGRSVYYGILLYLGHLTSRFWVSVFVQAAIFIYLMHTLIVRCLKFSLYTFSWMTGTVLIATPISFYISYLMPDVFASYLILATIILVVFWDTLTTRHHVIISLIILFSVLVHTSHLLLLAALACAFMFVFIFVERRAITFGSVPRRMLILLALFLGGILGEVAFYQVTRLTIGMPPIRPPFLMARMIDDGPGYQFLKENCKNRTYVVCNYVDRMPIAFDDFLWSFDPKRGVFGIVDPAQKRSLSDEQFRFALDVVRFAPVAQSLSSFHNVVRQFGMIDLNNFYFDAYRLDFFQQKIPFDYFNEMTRARILFNKRFLDWTGNWFFVTYISSIAGISLIWLAWPFLRTRLGVGELEGRQWYQVLTIVVLGVMFNAVICGALAVPSDRFQTRIAWIPLFVLLLLIASRGKRKLT